MEKNFFVLKIKTGVSGIEFTIASVKNQAFNLNCAFGFFVLAGSALATLRKFVTHRYLI